MTEREQFEAWAKPRYAKNPHFWLRQIDDGGYSCYAVDMAWKAVQAATQRQQERIAELEAQVQALSLDAGRLDAIENANAGRHMWIVARGKDSFTVALKSPYGNCITRRTLREAIDAAIAAGKGEA